MRLLVYLEPTPYILGLWEEMRAQAGGGDSICFVHENLSQGWNLDLSRHPGAVLLAGGPARRLWNLARRVCDRRVRLVHLAGWSGPYLLAALLLAKIRGIPVFVETDTPQKPGEPRWKAAVKAAAYPALFSGVTGFLPAGTRQARYLESFGVAPARIRIARMTVDVEKIAAGVARTRQSTGGESAGGTPGAVFLYIGRLVPGKGPDLLVQAFSTLQQSNVSLVVAGDGPLRQAIVAAAERDPRIQWIGRKTPGELIAVMAVSDVLVLPSVYESWGLVVNEAMAAGLPVIATDAVGCVDDLVFDGSTGYVVPAGDAHALALAMSAIAANPDERRRMGENASRVIAPWTLANEAATIVAAWKDMGNS